MKKKHTLFFIIFAIFSTFLFSGIAPPDTDGTEMIHEAEGFHTINPSVTKEMARELAIDNARIEAVKPLGVSVDSDSVYSRGLKIADWDRIKAGGYIVHDEVIAEKQKDGGYWVQIKAWIKSGREEEEVNRRLLNQQRILIVTDGPGSKVIEEGLAPLLSNAGYTYFDSDLIRANLSSETWNQLKNRQVYYLNPEAYKFMADFVIHIQSSISQGSEESLQGIYNYRANADIRLFQLSSEDRGTGKINIREKNDRIFKARNYKDRLEDLSRDDSGYPNSFNKQIAEPVVTKFMQALVSNKAFGADGSVIELTISKIPSPAEYHKFLNRLKAQHQVESGSIEELEQKMSTYRVRVLYRLKSLYLANLLTVDRRYRIKACTWNAIELEYTK